MPRPNVIFLIIDSLRYDRTGLGGHQPSPTPAIDHWLKRGLRLHNAFSVGCPTEFAYPGLTTSTLPLDYGGYAQGITHRPKALAEVFRDAGYHTMRLVHDSFESDGAYERGFEEMLHFYDVRRLHECAMVEVSHFRRLHRSGAQSLAEAKQELAERVSYKFREFAGFARQMQEEKAKGLLSDSVLLQGYDYEELARVIAAEETRFRSDPAGYAERIIVDENSPAFGFLPEFTQRHQNPGRTAVDGVNRGVMLRSLMTVLGGGLRGRFNSQALRRQFHYLRHPHRERVKFPSGGYLIKKLCDWIGTDHGSRPFLAWVHTVDVHEQNCWSYDVAGEPDRLATEASAHRELLRRIAARGGAYGGNPVYDLSVRYTDLQVERLFRFLESSGRLDDTLVVLTADHGHNSTAWPVRPVYHVAEEFYDDLYHVPVGFVGAGTAAREWSGLASSLDIGATVLGLAGLPVPASFRGQDLSKPGAGGRSHVLAEHMGRGLCDLKLKPVKLCVRTPTAKLVYEVEPTQAPDGGVVRHYYNLAEDPQELVNLGPAPQHGEFAGLRHIAVTRVAEIRAGAEKPVAAALTP